MTHERARAPQSFESIVVGDIVIRNFYGDLQKMKVSAVDDTLITAGMGWQFERLTGYEYDEDLRSGSKFGKIISFLVGVENETPTEPPGEAGDQCKKEKKESGTE